MNDFGTRLRNLRLQRRYSIKQMATSIGVAESTYREWEHGRDIKGEPYIKIAHILNISLYELLTGERGDMKEVFDDLKHVKNTIETIEKNLGSLL